MDIAYLHLLVNHFPVVLSVIGVAAAFLALIVRRRGIWLYAAASLTLAGASGYPVMLTGHGAEHEMDHRWYVVKESIEAHEDAADVATWVLLGSGVVNAFAWWLIVRGARNDTSNSVHSLPSGVVQGLIVITALASAGTVGYAAYEGGQIVHGSPRLASPPVAPAVAPMIAPIVTAPAATSPAVTTPAPSSVLSTDTVHDSAMVKPVVPAIPAPHGAKPK